MSDAYQGWTNRETYSVWTLISNDRELYTYFKSLADSAFESKESTLAENLKGYFHGLWFTVRKGKGEHQDRFCRMLECIGSQDRVNWLELATAFIGALK